MYAIMSDIHGNMFALNKVVSDMEKYDVDGIILLGDLIDYGMQSNEVVEFIQAKMTNRVICSIWGNHERAILTSDYKGFSSARGVDSARHTRSCLLEKNLKYLNEQLVHGGLCELEIEGKKVLAVHGSLEDCYWKAVDPDNVRGEYCKYDVVFSGHSHCSHMFSKFFDVYDPTRRHRHAVLFINPGSVGQPRNHNCAAQYVLYDPKTQSVNFRAVEYDVEAAMALFDGSVHDFYRARLANGI